jgi:hypothetical protein
MSLQPGARLEAAAQERQAAPVQPRERQQHRARHRSDGQQDAGQRHARGPGRMQRHRMRDVNAGQHGGVIRSLILEADHACLDCGGRCDHRQRRPPSAGVAVYVIGHALVKVALFRCVGIVLHRLHSVNESWLHGRGKPGSLAGGGADGP